MTGCPSARMSCCNTVNSTIEPGHPCSSNTAGFTFCTREEVGEGQWVEGHRDQGNHSETHPGRTHTGLELERAWLGRRAPV
jgi:hypothetical protein